MTYSESFVIREGIINKECYNSSSCKLLFIFKEPIQGEVGQDINDKEKIMLNQTLKAKYNYTNDLDIIKNQY